MKRLIMILAVTIGTSWQFTQAAVSPHTQDEVISPMPCQSIPSYTCHLAMEESAETKMEFQLISNRKNTSQIEKYAWEELSGSHQQTYMKYALYFLYASSFLFVFIRIFKLSTSLKA